MDEASSNWPKTLEPAAHCRQVRKGRADTDRVTDLKDKAMLERLKEIEGLDQEEKNTVVHVIDSQLRDAKGRKTYATQR